jgi:hypothetical protein
MPEHPPCRRRAVCFGSRRAYSQSDKDSATGVRIRDFAYLRTPQSLGQIGKPPTLGRPAMARRCAASRTSAALLMGQIQFSLANQRRADPGLGAILEQPSHQPETKLKSAAARPSYRPPHHLRYWGAEPLFRPSRARKWFRARPSATVSPS